MRAEPICDYCRATPVLYSYPATDFLMIVPLPDGSITKQNSHGAWATCQDCHDLIEGQDLAALAERSTKRLFERHPEMRATFGVEGATKLHRGRFEEFVKARSGAPVPASEVDWDAIPDYNMLTEPDGTEHRFKAGELPDLLDHQENVKLVRNQGRKGSEWLEFRDYLMGLCQAHPEEIYRLCRWEHNPWSFDANMIGGATPKHLAEAQITVWETDQWQIATSGHRAFFEVPAEVQSGLGELWVFTDDMMLPKQTLESLQLDVECSLSAILINESEVPISRPPIRGRFMIFFLAPTLPEAWWSRSRVDGRGVPVEAMLPRLRAFPVLLNGDEIGPAYCFIEAARAFLNLPLVGTERVRTSRQVERAYVRAKPKHNPAVQQIVLRRLVRPHHEPAPGEEHKEVDWSCQWWVSGHWRRRNERWVNGKGPIWVSPFVKGPEEMPLRPPKDRIIRVRR